MAKAKSPMTQILNSINQKTEKVEAEVFNKIGGFVISRILSYRKDLVLICNEINKYQPIVKHSVYDFYVAIVPKNRKYVKKVVWDKHPDIDLIIEYYKCNKEIANEYLKLLCDEDIEKIRKLCYKGGRGEI